MGSDGDGVECFAAESHGSDEMDIFKRLDFTGCMFQEADGKVMMGHTVSIIFDLDESFTAIDNLDIDGLCLGVDGIIEEFSDDGFWALDGFSGCNFMIDVLR